jgi:hypothetical protein
MIFALMAGWILSRLPARKQKIYYSLDREQAKVRGTKKKSKLWKMVWNASKPVIAAYLAKELAQKVNTPASGPAAKRIETRERERLTIG